MSDPMLCIKCGKRRKDQIHWRGRNDKPEGWHRFTCGCSQPDHIKACPLWRPAESPPVDVAPSSQPVERATRPFACPKCGGPLTSPYEGCEASCAVCHRGASPAGETGGTTEWCVYKCEHRHGMPNVYTPCPRGCNDPAPLVPDVDVNWRIHLMGCSECTEGNFCDEAATHLLAPSFTTCRSVPELVLAVATLKAFASSLRSVANELSPTTKRSSIESNDPS